MFSPFDLSGLLFTYCESTSTELVVWVDILPSNVGGLRFSPLISSMVKIPIHIKGMIIGLILSDASIIFAHPKVQNSRLTFQQSLIHFKYFWHVYTKLSHYCKSIPYFSNRVLKGKSFYILGLATRSLPCFIELRNLFYLKGIKVIPYQIFELLTPVALAHWICGDGTFSHGGLLLCTDSFTIPECVH